MSNSLKSKTPLIKYSDILCEGTLHSADQIINRWNIDRYLLAKSVSTTHLVDPFSNILSKDDSCKCQLGIGGKPFTLPKTCAGCLISSRLYHKGDIIPDQEFTINFGTHVGLKLKLITFKKGINLSCGLKGYSISKLNQHDRSQIIQELSQMRACENSFNIHVQNTIFWESEGALDQYIMVSSFLEHEFEKVGIPVTPIFKWAFQCDCNINIIDEVPSLGRGTFDEIRAENKYLSNKFLIPEISEGIILQLVSTLHFLSTYAFVHSNPCLHYLGFSKTPVNYIYDGVTISSKIGLRLIPSGCSSISAADDKEIIRIYHPGSLLIQSADYTQVPKIETMPFITLNNSSSKCSSTKKSKKLLNNPCMSEYLNISTVCYKIGNVNNFEHYIRHLGIPLFYSSFDLYCFFTALMCEELFYNSVKGSKLANLWKKLWLPNEYSDMMINLRIFQEKKEPPQFKKILIFLSKYYLRCDAVNFIWAELK
jgi:hypothetical protein